MFEISHRDAMGRVGKFKVGENSLETPLLLPVINPRKNLVSPQEMGELGFSAVITNSYIIYRNDEQREHALSRGVKDLLGFDGAVMTDSGSYQLYRYGEVEVSPDEIVNFQESIGSDIGVMLDIPTPPDTSWQNSKKDLDETLKRAQASISLKKKMLLCGTVQGSTHLDLREESAKNLARLDFDIYPIGGVVPLLEAYRFRELAEIIIHSKMHLPPDKPVHLFGAGHPMMFALAVSLGCDIFDSAAYYLYAKDGRYITPSGTLKLDEMSWLPCGCPICSSHDAEELKSSEQCTRLLALHNLYVSRAEIETVKQAIIQGSLWELVENRCRAHPNLLDALRILKKYPLEKHEPLSKKSAFFYSGVESLHRPEVKRHLKRLDNCHTPAKKLILLSHKQIWNQKSTVGSAEDYQVCYVSPVFGIIPSEVREVYPLSQHVTPDILDSEQVSLMKSKAREYAQRFDEFLIDRNLGFLELEGGTLDDPSIFKRDDTVKAVYMGDYQFGGGAGKLLFDGCSIEYSRTGRPKYIRDGDVRIASVRASDGIIVPSAEGARRLHRLKRPRNRVVVEDAEVCSFIRSGKSVFNKFIVECDPEIVPGCEVIVVDEDDALLNWGRALLGADELLSFNVGVGVDTRGKTE